MRTQRQIKCALRGEGFGEHKLTGWVTRYGKRQFTTETEEYEQWRKLEIERVRMAQALKAQRERDDLAAWLKRNGALPEVGISAQRLTELHGLVQQSVETGRLFYRLRGVLAFSRELVRLGYSITGRIVQDGAYPAWPDRVLNEVDTWFDKVIIRTDDTARMMELGELQVACYRWVLKHRGPVWAERVTAHSLAKYFRARGISLIRQAHGMTVKAMLRRVEK